MYASVSWPGWACLAVSLLLRWEQTPFHNSVSIREHTLSFLWSHLLMKLGYVWESDQLIFHPFPKYFLMDPSHLTTSKLLLVCSKLKASLTQSFPNIAAHGNHLGSLKTTAVCLSPPVSVTSLLLGVHWEVRFLNAPHIGILICSKVWKPLILELLMYWRNGVHSC